MGYSIHIVKIHQNDGKYYKGSRINETGYSYNWSKYRNIWHVLENMHGMKGSEIVVDLEEAFKKLDEMGISVGVPDYMNTNWAWGTTERVGDENPKQLPEPERMGVFYHHLKSFYDLAKKYPDYYFLSDGCNEEDSIKIDGNWISLESMENDSDSDTDNYPMVIPIRHPVKGCNVLIRTREDALEIFGILRQTDKVKAKYWLEIADKLPSEDD